MPFEIGSERLEEERSERYLSEMVVEAMGCMCCMAASHVNVGRCRLRTEDGVDFVLALIAPHNHVGEDIATWGFPLA